MFNPSSTLCIFLSISFVWSEDISVKLCQTYNSKGTCDTKDSKRTFLPRHVYISKREAQEDIEKEIRDVVTQIKHHRYPSCIHFIKNIFCYVEFPECSHDETGVVSRVVQACRSNCEEAKRHMCLNFVPQAVYQKIMNINCTDLPSFPDCEEFSIPTQTKIIEESCIRHSNPQERVSIRFASHVQTYTSEFYSPVQLYQEITLDDVSCHYKPELMNKLLNKLRISGPVQTLPNYLPNVNDITAQKYCLFKSDGDNIKYFKGQLGVLKDYRPRDNLRLGQAFISVIKVDDKLMTIAEGFYSLCYTKFNYIYATFKDGLQLFHGKSKEAIKVGYVELSHPIAGWKSDIIRYVFTNYFQVFGNFYYRNPTWLQLYTDGSLSVSAFKGAGFFNLTYLSSYNVQSEILIDDIKQSWAIKIEMEKYPVSELLQILKEGVANEFFNHFFWFDTKEIVPGKTTVVYSSDIIRLPSTIYGRKLFTLFKDHANDKLRTGLTITSSGIIKKKTFNSQIPFLENNSKFRSSIRIFESNTIFVLDIKFEPDTSQIDCSKTINGWENLFQTLKSVKNRPFNDSSSYNIKQCRYCCHGSHQRDVLVGIRFEIDLDIDSADIRVDVVKGNKRTEHRF